MKGPLFIVLLCAACVTATSFGGELPAKPVHTVKIGKVPPIVLSPGDSATVIIPFVVADGYHIQANPASSEFLIPTELRVTGTPGISLGGIAYPAKKDFRLEGDDDVLWTYAGADTITAIITVADTVAAGRREVTGSLRYQACDAKRCLFPAEVPVVLTFTVSE